MKNVIVGTAGHIDHGKSVLVQALTGTDPDRWEEEKRRGITIDLGFAHLDLPATPTPLPAGQRPANGGAPEPAAADGDDLRLGFVDVPGHERFVRNMLAGVGGIDLVLLVVAADESVKPQTREHFDICRLLGIERGLVALTKTDLVEPDLVELVRTEVEDFVQGSFLAGAPVVPVSARASQGLEQLKEALRHVALSVPGKDSTHYFRLPIDRAFLMKGFGTVVTGTLVSGSVARDEDVEVFPARRRVRVRGVQVHNQPVARARAGQRTALNLAGVEPGELARGMTLAAAALFEPTERVDVLLDLLPSARPLKHRARVHFHQGTAELIAEVLLLDRSELKPREQAFAQLRLDAPALLLPGDRFIIRQFSPVITIGGGRVLDALARKHKRNDPASLAHFATLARAAPDEVLASFIATAPRAAVSLRHLVARTGWRESELRAALERLRSSGRVRLLAPSPLSVAATARLTRLAAEAVSVVDAFHRREPLREGIPKEELRERVFAGAQELFDSVLSELTTAGTLALAGDVIKRAGRAVTFTPEEAEARATIEQAFARSGLTAPSRKEVLAKLKVEPKRAEKIVQLLLREKIVVKVSENLLFHHTALARLRALVRTYRQQKGERISVTAFKELAGVTRKYAIPLLEYLDRERVTRRVGNDRVILI
ncbi:MAG: selenocysteine-specific translation elongation factor [Terriglobia bacterium]